MMNRKLAKRLGWAALPVLIAFVFCGCATKPAADKPAGMEKLTPDKVVERLFSSFQFADLAGVNELFSSVLPEKTVKEYVADFTGAHNVSEFKAKTVSSDKNDAVVKVIYRYSKKDPKTGVVDYSKPVVELKRMELVKEGDYWKIRRVGIGKYDDMVEKALFYECLNAVMDATIAEEKVRQGRPTYTDSVSMLQKVFPVKDSACSEFRIQDAGKKSYMIVAETRNYTPCEITGNTDAHSPRRFEECTGK
jgi:hypothetical protein